MSRRKRPNGLTLCQAFEFVMGTAVPPPPDQCWLWLGGTQEKGYGILGFQGHNLRAHRVSYSLYVGAIAPGMAILHSCPTRDDPACVQPAHLRQGLHPDNMADAVARGSYSGENNGRAKLTPEQVAVIRVAEPRKRKVALALAAQYGVHDSTIYRIWSRGGWRSGVTS